MALRDNNLIDDESVILTVRTHGKALIRPFVLLFVLVVLAVAAVVVSTDEIVAGLVTHDRMPWVVPDGALPWVVPGALVVVAVFGVLLP